LWSLEAEWVVRLKAGKVQYFPDQLIGVLFEACVLTAMRKKLEVRNPLHPKPLNFNCTSAIGTDYCPPTGGLVILDDRFDKEL
jgi:hypothetical protein